MRPRNKPEDVWKHIDVREPDECWPWTKGFDGRGYGKFKIGGKHYGTHRLAYGTTKGPIPDGLHIMHSCDNPACCNPAHLSAGTPKDNVHDMIQKGRQNHTSTLGIPSIGRKLTAEQVAEIRSDHAVPSRVLAEKCGVSQVTILTCRRGESYGEMPGHLSVKIVKRRLTDAQREAIINSEHKTQREIAKAVGCSQATVSRVRDIWRCCLSGRH